MKQANDAYQIHLMRMRGFSDGAGTKAISPEYERDSSYIWAYSYGQRTKHMFSELSAFSLNLSLAEIHMKTIEDGV